MMHGQTYIRSDNRTHLLHKR